MLIESTNPKTVRVPHQAKWVSFRESRGCDDGLLWIFTDGSSLGGYGAVIVHPNQTATKVRGHAPTTSTRNVGAELNGLLLGLEAAPMGSRLAIVSDYLGVAAWMSRNWKIKDSEVREKIERARAIVTERNLTIERMIHHAGHQKDGSDFTRWNGVADLLAGGTETEGIVPLRSVVDRLADVSSALTGDTES
jgi:ribonuclease HI